MRRICVTFFHSLALAFALTLILALPSAEAQLAGDQYYEFERDSSTPRGADDSTTGSNVITASEATIILSPTSLSWSGEPSVGETPKTVTITNGGRLMSLGQINIALSNSNFTLVGNGCSSLSSGESCEVSVKPRSGLTGNFNGAINISTQSGKNASVPLSANLVPPTPPVENVSNCVFNGGSISRYRDADCVFVVPTRHTYTFYGISVASPNYNFPITYLILYKDGASAGNVWLTHSTGVCGDGATRHTHRTCWTAHTVRSLTLEPGVYTTKWYNSTYRNRWDVVYLCVKAYAGAPSDVAAVFGSWPHRESNSSGARC